MLEIVLDNHILLVLMGIMTGLGILSKLIVNVSLKRLVYASGNMSKSNHPLMRLVRAKFEHACMISDKVENVPVFVDKYLYEYKVAGMKLHSWRRMEKAAAGLCLLTGAVGAGLWYMKDGVMQDMVLKTAAAGAGLAVLIFLFHLTTDENFRLDAIHNYMVDYLENVCLHKYEKEKQKELKVMAPEAPIPDFGVVSDKTAEVEKNRILKDGSLQERELQDKGYYGENQYSDQQQNRQQSQQEESFREDRFRRPERAMFKEKEVQEPVRPEPVREVPEPSKKPEIEPPVTREVYQEPGRNDRIQAMTEEKLQDKKTAVKEKPEPQKEEPLAKDVLIRQILEEFMA